MKTSLSKTPSFRFNLKLVSTLMKPGMAIASLALIAFSPVAAHAADACGAGAAVANVTAAVKATGSYLARLDGDVDKCFNPSRPQYVQQTHQLLGSLQAQYTQALGQLAQAQNDIASNQPQRFVGDAGQVVANLSSVNKPVFDQASNLKNYGFTTSDSTSGGQYKYPQCNSRNNDNPAGTFAAFYSNIGGLRQALSSLSNAVTCVQRGN